MARKPKLSKEQKKLLRKRQKEGERIFKNGQRLRNIFPVLDRMMDKPCKSKKVNELMATELGKTAMAGMMVEMMKMASKPKTKSSEGSNDKQ